MGRKGKEEEQGLSDVGPKLLSYPCFCTRPRLWLPVPRASVKSPDWKPETSLPPRLLRQDETPPNTAIPKSQKYPQASSNSQTAPPLHPHIPSDPRKGQEKDIRTSFPHPEPEKTLHKAIPSHRHTQNMAPSAGTPSSSHKKKEKEKDRDSSPLEEKYRLLKRK
ncbi:hypothetical protein BDK51DRAFT_50271, partial [Blyttiomyces helicus]